MTEKDEMSRILANPDNLIVSDSLLERIDFGEVDPVPEISVKLTCNNEEVPGRFIRYKTSLEENEEEVKISFACEDNQLTSLFNVKSCSVCDIEILENKVGGTVSSVSISSSNAELVVTIALKNIYLEDGETS
jgi:hypothetical protein